jgi:hypothetical protein
MPETARPASIDHLAHLLEASPYDLARVDKTRIEDLWKDQSKRSFVLEPQVQVAGYLEVTPTILIADCLLGTLGLVYCLEDSFKKRAATILDQATYLRHLLLMEAGVDTKPLRRAYTVECVLVLPSRDAQQDLKHVFRHTARQTSFWHSIGVNVLVSTGDEVPQVDHVRRAFAWLLAATRNWLNNPPAAVPASCLRKVVLTNYRLPGEREWTLASEAKVHLLHGQNGSGKSSIAEALELSVTGTATRLQARNVSDYAEVIRNRHSTDPAVIRLEFDKKEPWSSTVKPAGVEQPLKEGMPVSSFRLDQDAMDDLARRGPAQRAEVFLGSFFPNERGVTVALNQAREALDANVRTLPPELQEAVDGLAHEAKADIITSRVAWVDESRPPTTTEIDVCRPMSRESLDALRPFSQEITDFMTATQFADITEFERLFKNFNEALERLRKGAGARLEAIGIARQCLAEETIRTWRPATGGDPAHEWHALLERWTEKIALADLAERHLQLSQSLLDAGKDGWIADPEMQAAGLFLEPEDKLASSMDVLRKLFDQADADRKATYEQLMRSSSDSDPTTSTVAIAGPELSARQSRALTVAGEALGPSKGTEGLGQAMDRAFSQHTAVEFGELTIGGSDTWATQLDARLTAVQSALTNLTDESYVGPMQRRENLRAARKAGKDVTLAAQRVKDIFLNELRNDRFNAALNELMSLFTPARWAYDDIEVTRGVTAGKDSLELKISGSTGSTADLLWNTAELNVFTLAMYLLAAVRTENPLGILLFDDPLQNMDELTVTTVARGLAKVVTVFPAAWQLVFLFHGEDDLERFRQEIPAAVYLLPWLAPAAALSDEVSVGTETLKSTFRSTLQDLDNVVVRRDEHADLPQ